jgi:uncharacterized membrane protein YkvA (DUF1232 family)
VWWEIVLSVLGGIALLYVVMLVVLWRVCRGQEGQPQVRQALRLLPDLVRLLRGLARDPELPRGVRLRLALLVVYLVSPIDLVPDVIPVLGHTDDALIAALALRSVARRAGAEAIERHWTGTPEGLSVIQRLAGTRPVS